MLVGYARVSTDLQTTDGQIDALNAVGCERVFEESMSGTRTDRPKLAAALEFAREGDVLVVARLDRLARSLRQLLTTVDALKARGIGLRSLHENIDTTSATGRLILHIFAALGQFEVELLRERTRTALAASRARGRIGGRQPATERHQGQGSQGNAGIRHHVGRRSRPAGRVQFLHLVSPCAGRTRRSRHGLTASASDRRRRTRRSDAVHLNKVTSRLPLPMGLPYRSRVKSSCESDYALSPAAHIENITASMCNATAAAYGIVQR
jgi:DNA invertase Pin-like site-specific DNA recombinase